MIQQIEDEIQHLKEKKNFRSLPPLVHDGKNVVLHGQRMLNLSSNDYLGLANDRSLREGFLHTLTPDTFLPTSSSSRLLTGNFTAYQQLEQQLADLFGTESALLFNSGYHANTGILPALSTGILPALSDSQTLILADKLVHASLIDGIRLSAAKCIRYRHNDMAQLTRLVEANEAAYRTLIIVTESIFSMDGDEADLHTLVGLKSKHPSVRLYVDEAHAFGVRGKKGLGCAEEQGCIGDIDLLVGTFGKAAASVGAYVVCKHEAHAFGVRGKKGLGCAEEQGCIGDIDLLVGTFGKAAASVGAYVVCKHEIREYLINKMRTFIFTTALPPVNIEWTAWVIRHLPEMQARRAHLQHISRKLREAVKMRTFIFTTALPPVNIEWTAWVIRHLPEMQARRAHLQHISRKLREAVAGQGYTCPSVSHIVPLIVGSSEDTVIKAEALQRKGFYALPVRPPTVPEGTSRIRFSLTADITEEEIDQLITLITK